MLVYYSEQRAEPLPPKNQSPKSVDPEIHVRLLQMEVKSPQKKTNGQNELNIVHFIIQSFTGQSRG